MCAVCAVLDDVSRFLIFLFLSEEAVFRGGSQNSAEFSAFYGWWERGVMDMKTCGDVQILPNAGTS